MRASLVLLTVLSVAPAHSQEPSIAGSPTPPAETAAAKAPAWPRVGGHFGLALPIAEFNNDGTTVIGRNFAQVGVTPGITVKLDDHWAIDFEFIAFARWDLNGTGVPDKSHTLIVVDPGVVYNFGRVAAGLRLAVQIGEGVPLNFGIVPIVVVPFKISSKLSYFLELDLPVFVHAFPSTATASDRVIGSLTILLQTGFAF